MIWVFAVVAALVIVAIALVAVGRVTAELATTPRMSVFDLDEAVEYVAERLPDEATAQLSYDDVRDLLGWHLDYLEERGAATEERVDELIEHEMAEGPVLTDEEASLAWVIGRATDAGLEVDDVHVAQVIDLQMDYLAAIGAIGSEVPEPPDPG